MPTSEKQIEANRRNAQKSTGPKSNDGKDKASQNAVKHGLYARHVVINSPTIKESAKDYLEFVEAITTDLEPATAIEHELVRKIATCMWRARRAIRAETAQINHQLDDIVRDAHSNARVYFIRDNNNDPEIKKMIDQTAERLIHTLSGRNVIPRGDFAAHLLRYEMRLDRQLSRTFNLLDRLQQRRKTDNSANGRSHSREGGNPESMAAGSQGSNPTAFSSPPDKGDRGGFLCPKPRTAYGCPDKGEPKGVSSVSEEPPDDAPIDLSPLADVLKDCTIFIDPPAAQRLTGG